jgi:hypothetical protein
VPGLTSLGLRANVTLAPERPSARTSSPGGQINLPAMDVLDALPDDQRRYDRKLVPCRPLISFAYGLLVFRRIEIATVLPLNFDDVPRLFADSLFCTPRLGLLSFWPKPACPSLRTHGCGKLF